MMLIQSGDFWSGLIIGVIAGGVVGILSMALAVAAKDGGRHDR